MRKVILLISILLLATLVLIGGSCGEENGEENREEEERVGGSCNRIVEDDSNSVCTDYIGANAHKSAPCPEEYYLTEPCPSSPIGGCKFNPGSDKEYIIWSYYSSLWTEDAIIESRDSCNALRTYRGMDTQAVSPTK